MKIIIQATGKTYEKLEQTFNSIEVNIQNDNYYIIATTNFICTNNFIIDDIISFKNGIFNLQTSGNIEYKIWMPDYLELHINNKFGNIYIDNHQGELNINLSNGNLKAGEITGKSTFKLSFGNALINKLNNANIDLKYVNKFQLFKADYASIKSTLSEIKIREIKKLNFNSKRDEIELKKVGSVQGICFFSTINIDELGKSLNIKNKYGDLEIEELKSTFQSMSIYGNYCDIIINTNQYAYTIDLIGNNTDINIPSNIDYTKTMLDNDNKSFKITGKTNGTSSSGKISGNLKSGSFTLIESF